MCFGFVLFESTNIVMDKMIFKAEKLKPNAILSSDITTNEFVHYNDGFIFVKSNAYCAMPVVLMLMNFIISDIRIFMNHLSLSIWRVSR